MKKPARTWVPVVTLGPFLAVVVAGAFWASFTALTQVGEANGVRPAWLLPVVVDVGMIGTNVGSALFRARGLSGRWLANTMFGMFAAISIYANVTHGLFAADFDRTTLPLTIVIASLFPVAQLGLTHVLLKMFPDEKERAKLASIRETEAAKHRSLSPAPEQTQSSAPAVKAESVAPVRRATIESSRAGTQLHLVQAPAELAGIEAAAERQVLEFFAENGTKPSGSVVGEWLGKEGASQAALSKAGQRFLKRMADRGAFDESAPPTDLGEPDLDFASAAEVALGGAR